MVRIKDLETLRKVIGPIGPNYKLVFEDGSELCMELGSLDDINAEMILSKVPVEKPETSLLDQLESGPWPQFVRDMKEKVRK